MVLVDVVGSSWLDSSFFCNSQVGVRVCCFLNVRIHAVNFFGMIRCCKAFLPLFKEQSILASHTGARIINITSMAGYISNGLMGMSAYVASKHAANAFSHCLRTELPPSYNIQVCTINPSFHKTPLVDTMDQVLAKKWETLDPKLKEEYGEGKMKALVCVLLEECEFRVDSFRCCSFTTILLVPF